MRAICMQVACILRDLLSVRAACAILLLPGFLLLPCFVRMVTGLPPLLLSAPDRIGL